MDEITTTVTMIFIFCSVGVILPMFLMIKDENKNPQSALPNKLILWITMVFCMILIFGIIVDFKALSETIRGDIIKYGFLSIMLFGVIFGIDQLLKSKYIKTVKWKDLTVETNRTTQNERIESQSNQSVDSTEPKQQPITAEPHNVEEVQNDETTGIDN